MDIIFFYFDTIRFLAAVFHFGGLQIQLAQQDVKETV